MWPRVCHPLWGSASTVSTVKDNSNSSPICRIHVKIKWLNVHKSIFKGIKWLINGKFIIVMFKINLQFWPPEMIQNQPIRALVLNNHGLKSWFFLLLAHLLIGLFNLIKTYCPGYTNMNLIKLLSTYSVPGTAQLYVLLALILTAFVRQILLIISLYRKGKWSQIGQVRCSRNLS